MREADSIVGHPQVLEQVQLAAAPDAAMPVLVAGEILKDRNQHLAVRVSRIGIGDMVIAAADAERAVGLGAAVEHETVEVGMGGVALEFPHPGSTWPDVGVLAFVRSRRMLRQGEPETRLLGTRGHVVAVDIVRIGDPEGRRRVVGRDQDILGALAGRARSRSAPRSGRAEVCRNTGFAVGMAFGHYAEVVNELVAGLHRVFEEEAVTHGVEGHVVFDPHVIGAMHGHAAAVGVVNRRVLDILPLSFADDVPMDRIAGQVQILPHAIQLDAGDIHLGPGHRHDMPPEVGLFGVG